MDAKTEPLDQNVAIDHFANFTVETKSTQRYKMKLLYDSSIFYKGLIGMILCILPGAIIGLVLIKMSLEQSKEALNLYVQNPNFYQLDSFRKVKKGRSFAFIGLGLFILEIVGLILYTSI